MTAGQEIDAVRAVAIEYLEGMIWGQEDRLRRAFHPGAIQVRHYKGGYEFLGVEEFYAGLKAEPTQPAGTPYVADIVAIEITGDVAVVKVTDSCFGSDFTDYLVMVKHAGVWQIVTKAFFVHSGEGLRPA